MPLVILENDFFYATDIFLINPIWMLFCKINNLEGTFSRQLYL